MKEQENQLSKQFALQSYSLNDETIDYLLKKTEGKAKKQRSSRTRKDEPAIQGNQKITSLKFQNNMRSPDLKKIKKLESICVYENYARSPEQLKRKLLFQEPYNVRSPLLKDKQVQAKGKPTKILRRNKKKFNFLKTFQSKEKLFSKNKRDVSKTDKKRPKANSKFRDNVNIYSKQYKTDQFINDNLAKINKKKPNTSFARQHYSVNKKLNRYNNTTYFTDKNKLSKAKYMSVDKYPPSLNSEIDQKNKQFMKILFQNMDKEQTSQKNDPVSDLNINNFKYENRKKIKAFTSPTLKDNQVKANKETFKSKNKVNESKMEKSGNSFFKYSNTNFQNPKKISRKSGLEKK